MASQRTLHIQQQSWPIAEDFKISRGSKRAADVVYVEIREEGQIGRGECLPYGHFGETQESVLESIKSLGSEIESGLSRTELLSHLPAGAARNAIDCALWDLEAKQKVKPVWQLSGLREPSPIATAYTLSLGSPEEMKSAAQKHRARPLLKIKLGSKDIDLERARLKAVRDGAPTPDLIIDANEGWTEEHLPILASLAAELQVKMIEQPLSARSDEFLINFKSPVPLGADESFHTSDDLTDIAKKYDAVNIKLDKTGGLTAAIQTFEMARALDLEIMIGCMVATSLSMAPALLLAPQASFVDLDGALLLANDRTPGLTYEGSDILPSPPGLWGFP